MKKTHYLLTLILITGNTLFAQTWDILNKTMTQLTPDWEVAQGSSASSTITQEAGYINFKKTNTGASARWAWVRPAHALPPLTPGTAYSIEVKARVNPINIPDASNYFQANQIALRLGSQRKALPIYLKYGDGTNNGYLSTTAGASTHKLNTSQWQIYRIVFHADHTTYDVYVDGIEEPIFENIPLANTSDQDGIYFGAESQHMCNIDVQYLKMGTGDYYSKSKIISLNLSTSSHVENTEKTITVTANTVLIDDGQKLFISMVDSDDNILVNPVEAIISQNKAQASLTIPPTIPKGQYHIKAAAPDGKIGNINIAPKTAPYTICYTNTLPPWALGGFERPQGKNPVIEPNPGSVFFCPMTQTNVKWEESDTFNPAAVVKDNKICVLYRAEDNSATGIGKRVSRVALAETTDGITMTRHSAPVFYPDKSNISQTYEWPGGCEDPRVAVTKDGTYAMYYTAYDRSTARLSVATSTDLHTWTKHGPIFAKANNGKYLNTWTKASSIVTQLNGDQQHIAEMNIQYKNKNWTYFMYWGEQCTYAAVSDDLINWTPLEDTNGNLLILANTRRGYFDSSLVECGPPAVITDNGILMLYNGRNATNEHADPRFNKGTYSAGQMLFDKNDPCKLLARTNVPFFRPMDDFEKSGQYTNGTVFIEGLVHYKKKWYLYYGCADSKVGVAIYDPANPADGDPIPDYEQGKGIANYPPHGIGKKIATIHSHSGHTKETESTFNLLYNYIGQGKWCENQNQKPWVIIELNDYYNIRKTTFRDVAPYENGNGNVPEYHIYTSTTGTEDNDWKEIVHKTNQQNIDVKEDTFEHPEEARYIKFVATRGTRTDNGEPENAIRIYGFDIYGTLSRPVDRGNIVSVGKTILSFNDASQYYCQPQHLLDGNTTNQYNRWHFNQPGQADSLKYVIIDLEKEYEIETFKLYDAGNHQSQNNNIDGYNIYISTTPPDLSKITQTEDKNTTWTKAVEAKGRRSQNIKTDTISPVTARYVKLEIPRSRTQGPVSLYQFEVHKKGNTSGKTQANTNNIQITPSILKSGDNITLKNFTGGTLRLYNLQGAQILNKKITQEETHIPIQAPAGTYIIELKNNNTRKTTKLIII